MSKTLNKLMILLEESKLENDQNSVQMYLDLILNLISNCSEKEKSEIENKIKEILNLNKVNTEQALIDFENDLI
jgi:hypothetical protein